MDVLFLFDKLKFGDLKQIHMRLELAEGTIRHPKGKIEDVLVRVGNLMVSTDFVVKDIGRRRGNEQERERTFVVIRNAIYGHNPRPNFDFKTRLISLTVLE